MADDAHQRRMLEQLRDVITWSKSNSDIPNVRLMITETGVPTIGEDTSKWAALMMKFYHVANHFELDVYNWSAGAWWDVGEGESGNSVRTEYCCNITRRNWCVETRDWLISVDPVTEVILDNQSTAAYDRGIALAGGEFSLGNEIKILDEGGVVGSIEKWSYTYHTDGGSKIWQLLADAGVSSIRFAFRLEALFDVQTGEFNEKDKVYFEKAIGLARRAGLKIMLDPHNYGALSIEGKGHVLGGDVFTTKLYQKILINLGGLASANSDVIHFLSIMTEPVNVQSADDWELYSQGAVDALRVSGYEGWIKVPTAGWQGANSAPGSHPNGFWIKDPLETTAVGVHFYHDVNQSGKYSDDVSYAQEEDSLLAQGFKPGVITFPLQ